MSKNKSIKRKKRTCEKTFEIQKKLERKECWENFNFNVKELAFFEKSLGFSINGLSSENLSDFDTEQQINKLQTYSMNNEKCSE